MVFLCGVRISCVGYLVIWYSYGSRNVTTMAVCGFCGSHEVFFDTICVCRMTELAHILWQSSVFCVLFLGNSICSAAIMSNLSNPWESYCNTGLNRYMYIVSYEAITAMGCTVKVLWYLMWSQNVSYFNLAASCGSRMMKQSWGIM